MRFMVSGTTQSSQASYCLYYFVTGPNGAPAYVAFVISTGETTPAVVPLGPAREIDALVARWSEEAGRPPGSVGRRTENADAAYRIAGEALRRRIWDSLAPRLGGARRVFIVPDGALHLVSFATLPDKASGYLVEREAILHLLSAERDLVPPAGRPPIGRGLLILGAPDFEARDMYAALMGVPGGRGQTVPGDAGDGPRPGSAPTFRGGRPACAEFRSVRFDPLPETGLEAQAIADLWRGEPVTRFAGARASEAAFKTHAPGRRVVHVATHGFFLGDGCPSAGAGQRGIGLLLPAPDQSLALPTGENPLLLSGLVLAGANHRGAAGPDEEDGILTAEEVAALDLSGVEWAVLSACDTGAGEVDAGEGVLGLRRAFQVAGAENVIMSLWPVEDRAGREWMKGLYEEHLRLGRPTSEAVRGAALRVLEARRRAGLSTHPFFWGGWVATGYWR